MATGILARKLGMTQLYNEAGQSVPVSVLSAGPCIVSQVKTADTDGYSALQLAFEPIRESLLGKAALTHLKKKEVGAHRVLGEFRDMPGEFGVGQSVTVAVFNTGDRVRITGVSKGKGFQGAVKRHGFGGGPAAHGSKFHRAPGSLGANTFPAEVWRGKKMPGRAGGDQITVRNVRIVGVDVENNLLFVKGAVPGAKTSLVRVEVMA